MPRLIAIEGPQTGAALPVAGPETFLGPGGRAAVLRRLGPHDYRIERLEALGGGLAFLVNGEELESSAVLNHGDLIRLPDGATLLFDTDDRGHRPLPRGGGFGEGVPSAAFLSGAAFAAGAAAGLAAAAAEGVPGYLDGGHPLRTPRASSSGESGRLEPVTPDPGPGVASIGESIRYRQKAYDDPSSVVSRLAGGGGAGPSAAPAADATTTHRLATLLKVSAAIGATLDLRPLLDTLLELVFQELPADRGTILLFDRERKKLRPMAARARHGGPGGAGGEAAAIRPSRTSIREAIPARESILTRDAMTDERFSLNESVAAARIRSAMCVPIVRNERVLGMIHLHTTETTRAFTREDLDLLTGIATMAALAIENARLYQEAQERERLRYELELAGKIQQRLLPKAMPTSCPDLDVYGWMQPAKELGGDYFDFIEDGAGTGGLHVFVGDVSGKGVGAGLILEIARSYLRPLAMAYRDSPRRVIAEANRLLYNDTNREIFMSANHLRWDAAAKRFVYCGAGQEHILVYRAATGRCEAIPAGGIALALVEDADEHLEERTLELAPGDAVVLYTDGVTEARSTEGKFFGLEALQGLVARHGALPGARAIFDAIVGAVGVFAAGAEQHDDLTLVAIKKR